MTGLEGCGEGRALSAVDFEWTLRRAIYILGSTPIKDLKEKKIAGLEQYRAIWKKEVGAESPEELKPLLGNWVGLIRAYELRNELIHGKHGATGRRYATDRVNEMLDASRKVCQFVQNAGGNVYARLRRVSREIE